MSAKAGDTLWDLSQLDNLNDDSILQTLKSRYTQNNIYTNCGDILIAINPCKELPIFGQTQHDEYSWDNITKVPPPHVFYVAARAYSRMRQSNTNQVILVSGESGAGKTESTKLMVRHFVTMCPRDTGNLHDRIVKVNPLLEAFGNAQTIMNSNSSRFAKYLELSFKDDGQVLGAVVRDYMLEKSRVTAQNDNEGNFHIFYALFAGASQEVLTRNLGLKGLESYRILEGNRDLLRKKESHAKLYRENMDVLRTIGLQDPDIDIIHSILGAILHLTQVQFTEPTEANDPLAVHNVESVHKAAELLSVPAEGLGHALISMKSKYAGEEVVRNKTIPQANDGRDALAKSLYERLFGWLVRKINDDLHPNKQRSSTAARIGILDIAGFEKLQKNSFEQMCINFVNERLQNFTNRNVFEYEMAQFRDEGIQIANTNFENNDGLIDMFNKKTTGILALLDETTKLSQGTDEIFVQRLVENHETNPHFTKCMKNIPQFGIKHYAGQIFAVLCIGVEIFGTTVNTVDTVKIHHDHLVWYSAEDFLEKNRDMLSEDISQCMKKSENEFIVDLFTVKKGPTGTISATMYNIRQSRKAPTGGPRKPMTEGGKQLMMELGKSLMKKCGQIQPSITKVHNPKDHKTVVSYFASSMRDLLDKMRQSEPYFVRCLKPNDFLSANSFDDTRVKEQLLYNGISAVAEIRKMNLPVRKDYKSFVDRYRIVLPKTRLPPTRDGTTTIMKGVLPLHMISGVKMGRTKVFMKDEVSIAMERIRSRKEHKAGEVVCRTIRALAEEKKAQKIIAKMKEDELRKQLASANNNNQFRDSSSSSKSSDSPENAGSSDDDTEDTEDSYGSRIQVDKLKDSVKHVSIDGKTPRRSTSNTTPPEPKEASKEESAFWDIFQIISREAKSQDVHKHRYLQILKIITYGFLSVLLFVCLVSQKISLMTLVSEPKESDPNLKSARYILVLIAMCIPYALIFLSNLWKSLFGNVPLPKMKSIVMVLIMEAAHACGLSLLVFRVLPEIDVVRGIMVLSATCTLPCILKPLCSTNKIGRDRCTGIFGKCVELILDLLACVAQISAIPILVLNHYYIKGEVFAQDNFKILEVALALFLCSFSWWENYIDDRFCGQISQTNSLYTGMLGIKFDLQESRPIIFTLASVLKAGIAIFLAYVLKDEGISFDLTSAFDTLDKQTNDVRLNSSIIILTVSAFVGHYVAYTACKLQMQRVSFSFPLLLATPAAVAIVYFDCEYKFLDTVSQEARECDAGILDEWWHLPIAAGWLLSVYWISRHIWFPSQERLAKVENLFLNPMYCGILLEQHLALNRRRHTRKIIKSTIDGKKTFNLTSDNASAGAGQDSDTKKTIPPMIYACATMWHETRQEMVQILKSLFRMDKDQFLRKQAVNMTEGFTIEDVEYYEFEPHILFDDAFETNDDDERVPNGFVKMLMEVMDEAASSVHEKTMKIDPPFKIPSPYGGQLVYLMPGENLMFVHLKDKNKIRHRKRWSQVMYMYYLLGYRIIKECQERVLNAIAEEKFNALVSWREFEKNITGQMGKSQIFQFLDDEVLFRAENTFILALDGDVDFTPGAVRMLLDKMQKNPRVGASCGRIHPIGKGPIVWYQKFEYAVAHWLQKATEHVLGCVLCSPGCFSLFRGSALMDDNVMKKYTILPSEASHHLMYDQGEDRWLCTLLLQQGYRVDYAAASDAFTYAPEGFDEFFNQRRRWMPSTIANILDLLQDGRNTVAINNNISWLYIFYQGCLMVSTVLGPSTVLMMIAGAIMTVFSVDIYWSYAISCAPAVLFGFMCFFVKTKYQLIMAQFLSAIYIFIMMVVFVGCIITAAQESPLHPSVLFLSSIVVIFLVAALFHPQEFNCIIYGALYFVCVPMGYLLLVVYSLCNLNVVSWGTREVPRKKTKAELEEEARLKKEKEEKKKQGFLARFMPKLQFQDFAKVFSDMQMTKKKEDETSNLIQQMNKNFEKLLDMQQKQMQAKEQSDQTDVLESVVVDDPNAPKPLKSALKKKTVSFVKDGEEEREEVKFDDNKDNSKDDDQPTIDDRCWVDKDYMGKSPTLAMHEQEAAFWEGFIRKYLKPLDADKQKQKETSEKLIELRNNVCGGMAIINLLWLAVNFMFQLKKPAIITFPLATNADSNDVNENNIKIDALGLMFIIFFVIILVIQFIGMLVHRWGTFLHLIAITEIPNPCGKSLEDIDLEKEKISKDMAEKTLEFCDKLLSEPLPDYPDNEAEEQDKNTRQGMVKEALKNLSEVGVKDGIVNRGGIGETMRQTRGGLGMSYRNTNALQRQSYTSQLRRSAGRTLGDVNFRQSIGNFLLRASRRGDDDPEDAQTARREPTFRRRYVQKRGGVQLGATLLNNISEEPLRHFGSQTPFQKDLLRRAKDRNIDHKIKGLNRREDGAANGGDIGMSIRRGHYRNYENSEEEDDIYDEIPAAGTLSRQFQKRFVRFQRDCDRGREVPGSRNSGINQWLS